MADTATTQKRAYAPRMAPEQRRDQILDAVLQVIVKQGVHKVSIDAVAKEAGVARPVLYGHFADSNALLRASLRREEAAAMAQMVEVLPRVGEGSAADAAVAATQSFLSAILEAPDRWRAILTLADSSTPTFRKRLELGRQTLTSALEDLARWGVADGLDESTDVELLAHMLLAMLVDAARLVLAKPKDFPPERVVAFAANSVKRFFDPPHQVVLDAPAPVESSPQTVRK